VRFVFFALARKSGGLSHEKLILVMR
jgi:hypothetical protein